MFKKDGCKSRYKVTACDVDCKPGKKSIHSV